MNQNNKKVQVSWEDSIVYYNNNDELPDKLSKMETIGELVKDKKSYIVLKNPKTKNYDAFSHRSVGEYNKDAKYLFIPRGMIKSINKIN